MKIFIALSGTPILYHITSVTNAASIVSKDRFELKPSDGTQAEESLGRSYYLSATRHKLGAYTQKSLYQYSVIFVLDGTKLAQRHKSKAIDYWGGYGEEWVRADRFEAEDRIFSQKPTIEQAHKYIKELHVHLNDKRGALYQLKRAALLRSIPIFFYGDRKDLLLLDKRKAVQVDLKPADAPNRLPSAYDYKYRMRNSEMGAWLELYKVSLYGVDPDKRWLAAKDRLSKTGYRKYEVLQYSDALNALNADLHNEKVTPYGHTSKGRERLDEFVKVLRKHKWTPGQFVQAMFDKWYKA